MDEGLAQRTHDYFIDVALAEFLIRSGRPVVGVMGGSSTLAADPNYRRVVHLTAALTQRGYLVVGGGGLGIIGGRESRRLPRRPLGRGPR
jgi:hypothetical protein